LFLLASCNTKKENTESTETQIPTVDTKEQSPEKCYRYATENDTVFLKLIHVGKSITGTLMYSLKEKDRNVGTIQGNMKGDILVADYTFMSEGVQSVRQVAFKLEDNVFVEGYGDIQTENNRSYFKNPDSLQFSSSMKLNEVACQ
jgi:hypothetical protein